MHKRTANEKLTAIITKIQKLPAGTTQRRNLCYEVMEHCKTRGYDDIYRSIEDAERAGYFNTIYTDPMGDEVILSKTRSDGVYIALAKGKAL